MDGTRHPHQRPASTMTCFLARTMLNDVDDTQALAGTLIDLEDGLMSSLIEAERQIGDRWKVEAEARLLVNVDGTNAFAAFKRDSFVNIRVSRFF